MNRSTVILAATLLGTSQLLSGCTKESLNSAPQPTSALKQNSYSGLGQYQIAGQRIVEVAVGTGNVGFFRVASTEQSGGNQLYTERTQSDDNPGPATYFPSPGAISIASRLDTESPLIITASNDISYQEAGSWKVVNSGGLKFKKIATRDLKISSNTSVASGVSVSGRLYAIGTDNLVYFFDPNTSQWVNLNSQTAMSIAVDYYGRPWIISLPSSSAGAIYNAAGYGQTFSGWQSQPTPINAKQLTINSPGTPGIIVFIPAQKVGSYVSVGSKLLWAPLSDPGNFQTLQSISANSTYQLTGVQAEEYGDKFWVEANDAANSLTSAYAIFTGL